LPLGSVPVAVNEDNKLDRPYVQTTMGVLVRHGYNHSYKML